ncbi:hypothetical protein TNIN_94971 [Trichonephila inaurata madagascariensis]|uniref:Uncharacterized protein n=1 Tax=Trichonephila inaurata madagascariensis TaxID=2747483 RepID=A0A8X7BU61_9ARAC|nr:hypothetical protein TNIN_94971 [Trichonephila inaurata madagascariensis]
MHDTRHTRSARTSELEEHVLREFELQPETSPCTVFATANVSPMTAWWRMLGAEGLRPYHAQHVHALKATDQQQRVSFFTMVPPALDCATRLCRTRAIQRLMQFHSGRHFNVHTRTYTNPQAIRLHPYQRRFSVDV